MFSVNPEIDFDFLYSLKINKYNLKNILFARDKNFEIDEKLWANKLNKILFSNQDQFLQVFQAMDIVAILSHGFRKKDFSSIKINNIFFNPYYLNELKKTPHIIFLLSCMMNYSNSDNNLINLLFKISTKLIFSTPFIIPLEYIESIFKILTIDEGNNQDIKISLFDLFIKILQTSFFSSSLFKILI